MKFYLMTIGGQCGSVEVEDRDSLPEEVDLPDPFWKSIVCIIHKSWWRYWIEDIQKEKEVKIKFIKEGGLYYAYAFDYCGFGPTKEKAMIDLMYKFVPIGRSYLGGEKIDCFINLYNH